jgi:hypothetical protein
MKRPKAPKPTAQQLAVERRQAAALDEEIREQEERFAAMARGKLGTKSLLGGVPRSRAEAAGGRGGAAGGARTMLGMGGLSGGASRGTGTAPRTSTYNGTMPQLR